MILQSIVDNINNPKPNQVDQSTTVVQPVEQKVSPKAVTENAASNTQAILQPSATNVTNTIPTPATASDSQRQPVVASSIQSQPALIPTTEPTVAPAVKYPDKPVMMSDSDYEHLARMGYSPNDIATLTKSYTPSEGGYMQRLFNMSVPKPSPMDQNRLKKREMISGIADALGLVSQMIGAGRGAHVRERGFNQSALAKTLSEQNQERDAYAKSVDRYNQGLYTSRMKDYLQGLEAYNSMRKAVSGELGSKRKQDFANAQFAEKQKYAYDKLAQEKEKADQAAELAKTKFGESVRHNKAMESQGWARVADSRNRTAAYVKNISSGSGKNYQMIFPANPKDTNNVQTDEFGNKVKVFEMNKGEIDRYTREALNNPSFMENHPELIVAKPNLYTGEGSYRYRPNQEIAAAYMKDNIYESQFVNPSITPTSEMGESYHGAVSGAVLPPDQSTSKTPLPYSAISQGVSFNPLGGDEWDNFEIAN